MKAHIFTCLLSITAFFFVMNSNAQTLEVEISNIQKYGGTVYIALYDNPSDWIDKPLLTTSIETEKNSEVVSFEVPYGRYAISIYQDVKGNKKMDTNFMGIPKDPIAFGNNYKPFGKPKFNDAALDFNEEYEVQTIKLYKIF